MAGNAQEAEKDAICIIYYIKTACTEVNLSDVQNMQSLQLDNECYNIEYMGSGLEIHAAPSHPSCARLNKMTSTQTELCCISSRITSLLNIPDVEKYTNIQKLNLHGNHLSRCVHFV